jgi:hypothetical protein
MRNNQSMYLMIRKLKLHIIELFWKHKDIGWTLPPYALATMASSRKRKRESTDDNTAGKRNRDDLSLQAFEAVINPIDRQQEVKLASGVSGGVSSAGLIEWTIPGLSEPILVDRLVSNW